MTSRRSPAVQAQVLHPPGDGGAPTWNLRSVAFGSACRVTSCRDLVRLLTRGWRLDRGLPSGA